MTLPNYDHEIELQSHPENFITDEDNIDDNRDENGNCLGCGEQLCVCDELEAVTNQK